MAKQKFRHEDLKRCGVWGNLRLAAENAVRDKIAELSEGRCDLESIDEALGSWSGFTLLHILETRRVEGKVDYPMLPVEPLVVADLLVKELGLSPDKLEEALVLAQTDRTEFVTARFMGSIKQITIGDPTEVQTTLKRITPDRPPQFRTNSLQGLQFYKPGKE